MEIQQTVKQTRDQIVVFDKMISDNKGKIVELIPDNIKGEKIIAAFRQEFIKNDQLKSCDLISIRDCLIKCCQLGLEPGPLDHVYLIPYKLKDSTKCTFILSYKGMLELLWRAGNIVSVSPYVYYDSDFIEIKLGTEEYIKHIPAYKENRKMIGVYCVVLLSNGIKVIDHMFKEEIDRIKEKSQSYLSWIRFGSKSDKKPIWEEHYESMAKKTLLRRMFNYLPTSPELKEALVYDNKSEVGNVYDVYSEEDEKVEVKQQITNAERIASSL